MIFFISLLCCLILLFSIFLLVPLILHINTDAGVYSIRMKGVFAVYLFSDMNNPLLVRFRIFAFPFKIDFLKKIAKDKSIVKTKVKEKKKKRRKQPDKMNALLLVRRYVPKILKTFKIKTLNLNVDTGNAAVNGLLTAFGFYVSKHDIQIVVNYNNNNSLNLIIQNRLIHPVWIVLRMIISNKH